MGRRKITPEQAENRRNLLEALKNGATSAAELVKANPTLGSAAAILGLWSASTRGWIHPTPATWAGSLLSVNEMARHTEGEIANALISGVGAAGFVAGGLQAMSQVKPPEIPVIGFSTGSDVTQWAQDVTGTPYFDYAVGKVQSIFWPWGQPKK